MLRVIELFAGIGSQRQALKNIGAEHEVVAISEIDRHCAKSYEAIHGETPNLGDIRKIERLPEADLWTYSFPCQDISIAGRLAGIKEGTRSGLLYEVERLLRTAKEEGTLPKYLLLENVRNLVSKRFAADFERWLEFLYSLGYSNSWRVLNAKDYGMPQNRERVFCVSILGAEKPFVFPKKRELKIKLADLLEAEVPERYYLSQALIETFMSEGTGKYPRRERFLGNVGRGNREIGNAVTTRAGERATDNFVLEGPIPIRNATRAGYLLAEEGDAVDIGARMKWHRGTVQKGVSKTLTTAGGNEVGVVVREAAEEPMGLMIRKLTPRECLRLMGWKDGQIDRIQEAGVSDTQQYKQAGNGIVVQVLEAIFAEMLGAEGS